MQSRRINQIRTYSYTFIILDVNSMSNLIHNDDKIFVSNTHTRIELLTIYLSMFPSTKNGDVWVHIPILLKIYKHPIQFQGLLLVVNFKAELVVGVCLGKKHTFVIRPFLIWRYRNGPQLTKIVLADIIFLSVQILFLKLSLLSSSMQITLLKKFSCIEKTIYHKIVDNGNISTKV